MLSVTDLCVDEPSPTNQRHRRTSYQRVTARIIQDISLDIGTGEATVILGLSGAGKTTLLHAMAGLISYQGDVVFLGKQVHEMMRRQPKWLVAHMGVAVQFPERSFFAATVRDELSFTCKLLGKRYSDELMRENLTLVGLDEDDMSRSPFILSGGEKRRLALACAVMHDPCLVLFDEPDAGLDWSGKRLVSRLILGLLRRGKSVVTVTHDASWALTFADRFVVLEQGRLKDEISVSEEMDLSGLDKIRPWLHDQGAALTMAQGLAKIKGTTIDPYRDPDRWLRHLAEQGALARLERCGHES